MDPADLASERVAAAGVVLFALGVTVSRHKELALERYRQVMAWPW